MFLIPLVVGWCGALYLTLATDADRKWKGLALAVMLVSTLIQFVPALRLHFLVPLLLQSAVAIPTAIYWQANR